MEYIHKIDEMGGAPVAIEKGFYQKEIADAAYKYQKDVESKKEIIIGVNEFVTEEEMPITTLKVDPEVRKRQMERLNKVKKERDNKKVEEALNKLRKAAEKGENIMPATFEAIKNYATIGETSNILREVFGEYKALTIV